jgi:hypothetical protein
MVTKLKGCTSNYKWCSFCEFFFTIVQRIVLYSVIHGYLFSMEKFALCNILLHSSDILFYRIWILDICVCMCIYI